MTGPPRRSSSLWSLANTVATIAASLAGFVVAANLVGTDRLGLLALTGAALFPLRFSELGLAGAVTRYVGAYAGADPRGYVWAVVRLGWAISLGALVILLGVCAVLSPPLLRNTVPAALHGEAAALVPLLIAQTSLQLLVAPLTASLLGMQRFRRVYACGVAVALGQLAAIVPLVSACGIAGMVLSQIGMHLAFATLFVPVLLRLPGKNDMVITPLDRSAFLRFTFQFSANSLLTTLLEPAAKLTLGAHAPLSVMGLFEVMWRMLVQLRTLLVAPLNPLGIVMIGQWQKGRDAVSGSYRVMAALALAGSAALILAAPVAHWGFALVTPRADAPGALVVSAAVALALALAFLTVPVHFLALAANDVRPIMAGTLTNLAVQLGLGWWLGRVLGWPGVLAAFVAAYAVAAAVQLTVTARLLRYRVIPPLVDFRAGFAALRGRII